jgi:transposase
MRLSRKGRAPSGLVGTIGGMGQNFIGCDRDQRLLLPPDLREWLPDGHLAWFVIEAVSEFDLSGFYADYRGDGWGRAAHDPEMMVALMLYSYAVGVRSSRGIERRCQEDVAFRVICAGAQPDHATIARFRVRHEEALADLFAQVLALCANSGLGSVGTVALDSTRVAADASRFQNRTYERIARELLEEAKRIDAAEDELYGEARGDELPPELRTREGRRRKLREAKARLDEEKARREAEEEAKLRERAKRRARCRAEGKAIMGRPPKPASERKTKPKALRTNLTDPDSRLVKTPTGFIQGYSAQAVVSDDHLIVAAEIAAEGFDAGQLGPMVAATGRELEAAGIESRPVTVLADAAYFNSAQIETLEAHGTEVLVATRSGSAGKRAEQHCGTKPPPPKPRPKSVRERMAKTLSGDEAKHKYKRRAALVEPVFGQIKSNRGCDRFARRGMAAVRSEWRLFAATHNLLRLWRTSVGAETTQPAAATA